MTSAQSSMTSAQSRMTSAQSGQMEATEVRTVPHARLESCYEAIDRSEIMHILPSITTKGFDKFQCLVCDILVPEAQEHAHMQKHLKDTTVEIEKLSGRIRFTCKICKFKIKTEYPLFLRRHVKFHEEAAKEKTLKGTARIQGLRQLYTFDTCRICKEQQEGPQSLFPHVIQHFPNSVFYCRVCFKIYNDYKSCRDHFNSHNLKVPTNDAFGVHFLCQVCGHLEIPNNSRKIIHHLTRPSGCWYYSDCLYSKGAFVCKPITENLLKFEHCLIVFDDTVSSCNFKCDDAASLCSHVLRHVLSVTVPKSVPNKDDNQNERQRKVRKKLSTSETTKSSSAHARLKNDSREIIPAVSKIENVNDNKRKNCKSCIICGVICMSFRDSFYHVFTHFTDNVFYCRGCFKTFNSFESADIHSIQCGVPLSNQGNESEVLSVPVGFVCSTCGQNYTCNQKQQIMRHLFQHYQGNDKAENIELCAPETKFACKHIAASLMSYSYSSVSLATDTASCGEKFDNVQSLCKHVQKHIIKSEGSDEHIVSGSAAQSKHIIKSEGSDEHIVSGSAAQSEKDDDCKSSVDIDVAEEEYFYEELNRSQVQALALTRFSSSTSTGESKCFLCENLVSPRQLFSHVDSHMQNTIIERGKNGRKLKFTCKSCNFVVYGGYVQFHKSHEELHNEYDSCGNGRHLPSCHICKKKSFSEEHLLDHILGHYPETVFYCRICFRTYKDLKTCKQHYPGHKVMTGKESDYGIYLLCPVCGELETPNPTWKIIQHLIFHYSHEYDLENGNFVSKPRKGTFQCKKLSTKFLHRYCHVVFDDETFSCEFKCDDPSTLNKHVQQHPRYYRGPSGNTQSSPSTCTLQENDAKQSELCQSPFLKSLDRKSPVKSVKPVEQHPSQKDMNLIKFANSVTLLNSYSDNILKKSCIICGGTSKREGVFEHVCIHFPDNVFYCRRCFKTFRNFLTAVQHSRQHFASCTAISAFEASTVGFICSLCGHNDLSSHKKVIIAHLFKHYDQTKDPEFGCPQKYFLCRRISESLKCFKHFEAEFDSATASCEEKFEDIDSLCDHIQQHIVKSEVKSYCEDSESTASTTSRPSENNIVNVKGEVVEPPCDLPSGRSVAIQFGEADTSNTTSKLSVKQCDVAELDIKDERDCLEQNITVALNAIKEEKMGTLESSGTETRKSVVTSQLSVEQCDVGELDIKDERDSLKQNITVASNAIKDEKVETLESNDKESRQSAELMDFNSSTSATTSQKVSQVPSGGQISVPYSSFPDKTSLALTNGPSWSLGTVQPKLSSKFVTGFSSHSKRMFETVFTSDSQPTALKQVKLDVLEEQGSIQSTGNSKIKIFVCKVCHKRFMGEHFFKKHMSKH